MKKFWQDIVSHKLVTLLFIIYWVTTFVVIYKTFDNGIPPTYALLILAIPLIAGFLMGLCSKSTSGELQKMDDRTITGRFAGVISMVITIIVMRGGAIDEVIGWMHGNNFQGIEVLEFMIGAGIFGFFLGWIGAYLGVSLEQFYHRLTSHSS